MRSVVLGDFGERRILREVIPQYVSAAGDDCASLGRLPGHVVMTTDPVPTPAAFAVAGDPDPYWMGWLLATINASDVAAAGAAPVALTAALEMPATFEVNRLHRLLAGIRDGCGANGLRYVGGNLREADRLAATGAAIGVSEPPPLTRRGARSGDHAVVFGVGGRFWADVERFRCGNVIDPKTSPLYSPVSQARVMHVVHSRGLVRCAMDTSDGLAPALDELSACNGLGLEVDLRLMRSGDSAPGIRPERLWMGWGDWTVLAAVAPEALDAAAAQVNLLGGTMTPIGRFDDARSGVVLTDGCAELKLGRLESERFAKDSWFAGGVDSYWRMLEALPLP